MHGRLKGIWSQDRVFPLADYMEAKLYTNRDNPIEIANTKEGNCRKRKLQEQSSWDGQTIQNPKHKWGA